jgi:hypothetical protein
MINGMMVHFIVNASSGRSLPSSPAKDASCDLLAERTDLDRRRKPRCRLLDFRSKPLPERLVFGVWARRDCQKSWCQSASYQTGSLLLLTPHLLLRLDLLDFAFFLQKLGLILRPAFDLW